MTAFARAMNCSRTARHGVELVHISKSGGTSMCQLAAKSGLYNPGTNMNANCLVRGMGHAAGAGQGLFPNEAGSILSESPVALELGYRPEASPSSRGKARPAIRPIHQVPRLHDEPKWARLQPGQAARYAWPAVVCPQWLKEPTVDCDARWERLLHSGSYSTARFLWHQPTSVLIVCRI